MTCATLPLSDAAETVSSVSMPSWPLRVPFKACTSSNACEVNREIETSSQLVIRGYVIMILPQVHLRNGELSAAEMELESDWLSKYNQPDYILNNYSRKKRIIYCYVSL